VTASISCSCTSTASYSRAGGGGRATGLGGAGGSRSPASARATRCPGQPVEPMAGELDLDITTFGEAEQVVGDLWVAMHDAGEA
jgi:hypothetical protein